MIKSLRRKFIAIAMSSLFLVLAVIVAVINLTNYQKVMREADDRLDLLAANDGVMPKSQKPHGKPGHLPEGMSPETPFETRYFTVTLRDDGTVSAVDTGNIAAIATGDAIDYARKAVEQSAAGGFMEDYKYRIQSSDSGAMVIFLDCGRELSTFRSFFTVSLLVSLVGLLSVYVLVLIFSRMVFRPVAESYEKQKQFITDAGHEIKTPLTIIDANTEVLEMENGGNEWTRSIRKQVERLSSLTNDLVCLSRMEEGARALTMADFCLSDAVTETADAFEAAVRTMEKTLTVEVEPAVTGYGNEASVRQLVSILLDNALKYSDEHGHIRLTLQRKGRAAILSVYNTAAQIEKGHQDKLFERFYRADPARSTQTGGHGIGLSIARSIVEAHKGKITAQSTDGQSLTITVVL